MVEYKLGKYEMLITSLRRNTGIKLEKCQSQESSESSKEKGQSEKCGKNDISSCFQNTSV